MKKKIIRCKYNREEYVNEKDNFKNYFEEPIFFIEGRNGISYSIGWNCYGLTVRGIEKEVDLLLASDMLHGCELKMSNPYDGIKEVKVVSGGYYRAASVKLEVVDKIIRNYPNLKVVSFWQGLVNIRPSQLYVIYSESGHSVITDSDFVTKLSAEDEYNPLFVADVTGSLRDKFHVSDSHSGYDNEVEVEYEFPFTKAWETYNYVTDEADGTYLYTEK